MKTDGVPVDTGIYVKRTTKTKAAKTVKGFKTLFNRLAKQSAGGFEPDLAAMEKAAAHILDEMGYGPNVVLPHVPPARLEPIARPTGDKTTALIAGTKFLLRDAEELFDDAFAVIHGVKAVRDLYATNDHRNAVREALRLGRRFDMMAVRFREADARNGKEQMAALSAGREKRKLAKEEKQRMIREFWKKSCAAEPYLGVEKRDKKVAELAGVKPKTVSRAIPRKDRRVV